MPLPIAILALAAALIAGCDGGHRPEPERTPERAPAPLSASEPAGTLSPARGPDFEAPRRAPADGGAARPRLREDPVAARRAEAQWRQHLKHEETERQLQFDRRKLPEHRALVRTLSAVRARYDRARTASQLAEARQYAARQATEMRALVSRLDPWGVNSRLLGNYDALLSLLDEPYPAARAAALNGDASALKAARQEFRQHMQAISDWLERTGEREEHE
jgi:hypothetical protein